MNIYAIKNLLLSQNPVSEHYLNRYIKLIQYAIENPTKEKKFDRHHILPKSMFPEYKSFSKNPWNKVNLSKRQHFIAHKILYRAFRNKEMTCAFWYMKNIKCEGELNTTSKEYERLREEIAEHMSNAIKETFTEEKRNQFSLLRIEQWKNEDYRKWKVQSSQKQWTKEKKKALSEKMSGEGNPMYGRKRPDMAEVNRRKEVNEKRKITMQKESYKKNKSEQSKKIWSDQEFHKRMCEMKRGNEFKCFFNYQILKSSGEIIETHNLKKWCRNNPIYNSSMCYKLCRGEKESYKDIIKITKELKRG